MDAEEVNTNHMLYGQLLYCSPMLFRHVASKSKTPCKDNRAKSDVFSIGMTILALGLDQSVQDCYDMKTKTFNSDKLNSYLTEFDNKFGNDNNLLCSIVRNCLAIDENERMTACQMLENIPHYDLTCQELFNRQTRPVEVEVESRPPVVVRTEEVETRPTVNYGERRAVAVYKIVNGERVLIEGTPIDYDSNTTNVVRRSYRQTVDPEVRVSSNRVIQAPVVRRSHVEGSRVVVADGTTGNVVRRSRRVIQGDAVRVQGDVVRSSRVVQGDVVRSSRVVQGEVRRVTGSRVVEGPTATGTIRRVEGPVTTTGTVRRVEGTTTTGTVRRVSGDAPVEGVVRRVSGDAPVEGVIRRVSGEAPVEGVVRRVSGENQVEGVVRRVSGENQVEEVVRKVSGENADRKLSNQA